jgi:hypothetical protein
MNLHLPVLPRTYGSAVNECAAWRDRALAAEAKSARQDQLIGEYERAIARLRRIVAGEEVPR